MAKLSNLGRSGWRLRPHGPIRTSLGYHRPCNPYPGATGHRVTNLKVELSDDAYKRLSEAADREGISVAELVRRALNLEQIIRESDAKVYLRDAERGELRELELA
jgi:predicted transcriptional regulator